MALTRESHPITDADLEKWIPNAEEILGKIKGNTSLETIYRDLTQEEKYHLLPEELELLYAVRQAMCLFFYFADLLLDRTGQRKDVDAIRARGGVTSQEIQRKNAWIANYGFFVAASYIVFCAEKLLRGKDPAKLARLETSNFELVAGKGFANDMKFAMSYYVANMTQMTDGHTLVQNREDLVSVTRDYWRAVVQRAATMAKEQTDLIGAVANVTFHYRKFVINGLETHSRKEATINTWAPVEPNEIVGDDDVTKLMCQQVDRVALYDPAVGRNPFCEFGGVVESIFLDGKPGTGKTTRMKMMMTRLARRAEQVGLQYRFKTITADQIKSEWYGKAAQLIAALLEEIRDPTTLALLFADDIDLLLVGDRSSAGTSGADLDIMKALMDFFSGTGSNYPGNYIATAATNKPTATDDALRQRFIYRVAIEGPVSMEDFSDLAALELRRLAKTGMLDIPSGNYQPLSRAKAPRRNGIPAEPQQRMRGMSWDDIGELCAEFKKKDPRFSGRPVKNAVQVAIAQSADFEIPEAWFADPAAFRSRPWDQRIELIKKLYRKITAHDVVLALERQFEVEQRYISDTHEREVEEVANRMAIAREAEEKLRSK